MFPVNITEVIAMRRITWACKIVSLSDERDSNRIICAVPTIKHPRGNLSEEGSTLFRLILEEWVWMKVRRERLLKSVSNLRVR